jgi:mycothiol synthase
VLRDPVGAAGVTATYVAVSKRDGVVATSSARDVPARFPTWGYVHWVAADPAHQGKGLGRAVLVRCLHHFRAQGHTGAALETDDDLLQALRLYLAVGFVPGGDHPSYAERWRRVMANLGR